jgi:prepilin-type N-terminal cleavage/methylation domain-containing protein
MPAPVRVRAFTLFELMIAITIVALLAALAIPAFDKVRQSARRGRYISDVKAYAGAIQIHAMHTGVWPASSGAGVVPAELADVIPFGWTLPSSLGGQWLWSNGGGVRAIVLLNPTPAPSDFAEIDVKIDDGNPATGLFQLDGTDWVYLVEATPP